MEPQAPPTLDKTALMERLDGDLELLTEITGLFLEDSPKLLSDIRTAVSRQDAHGLERAAHALKGCVANFGAQAAYEAALRLEKLGRTATLAEAPAACAELESEIDRFRLALSNLARELGQP